MFIYFIRLDTWSVSVIHVLRTNNIIEKKLVDKKCPEKESLKFGPGLMEVDVRFSRIHRPRSRRSPKFLSHRKFILSLLDLVGTSVSF